jgi:glycerophosphoryl diester phosphodiesterase
MRRRRARQLAAAAGGLVAALGVLYVSLWLRAGAPAPAHEFFRRAGSRPLVIAHRGGAGLWPENTLYAFERALRAGADVIEMDVRATADGALVVIHDASVERTTDGVGRVGALTLAELKRLDAAFRWSPDGGRTFPLRGRGVGVPTLEEVFERFPAARFVIEPKQDAPSAVAALCRAIRARGMTDKVLLGSFRTSLVSEFRRECPEVATSGDPAEVSKFLALERAGLEGSYSPTMQALLVPEHLRGWRVLTRSFVEAAHGRNLEVHAWTVNDAGDMRRLLDLGVDGIITDYPDRLASLLGRAPTN